MARAVLTVKEPAALQALSHPTRVEILAMLREPASAADVARRIGQSRQRVNYHLHELEDAKLIERVGERRTGNFVAMLYRAVARAFVVSPRVAWGDERRARAFRAQHALETLVVLGERLQHDAAVLLDRAAFDGEEIASVAVTAEMRFASEVDREAFVKEYVSAVAKLTEKYASKKGEPYRAVLATYPGGR